ncbi:hypothetical protein [Roseibium aggregatum]|uniref:hypothetical protein n=1 Tax=Roseibium aggregatum TaxID=187304 RepID=UPI0025AD1DB0|nr:hypothetical protein [Roseibium aggregatum]WJS05832.1 hypothetical protein QUB73_27825 [Roseibium aggregatum]
MDCFTTKSKSEPYGAIKPHDNCHVILACFFENKEGKRFIEFMLADTLPLSGTVLHGLNNISIKQCPVVLAKIQKQPLPSSELSANNADWIGCLRLNSLQSRDPMKGWRPRTLFNLYPCDHTSVAIGAAFEEMDEGEADITTTRKVELAEPFRFMVPFYP